MSKCDNKCHLVNLRNWEIDNHTLIYWNDKVYGAERCKHVDNLENLCKKVGYRVGGRGGCKQKHALCLEHYRASEGCTCQPPSETHMASIMNLRTTYEHQIRIQLPGATRNARDELPSQSGLPSPPPSLPSTSYSSMEKKKKKKKSKKEDKTLGSRIEALENEVEKLRQKIKEGKDETDEICNTLQTEITTTKEEVRENQRILDEKMEENSEQVRTKSEKIVRVGQSIIDLSNRKRSRSSDSEFSSESGSEQSTRAE